MLGLSDDRLGAGIVEGLGGSGRGGRGEGWGWVLRR